MTSRPKSIFYYLTTMVVLLMCAAIYTSKDSYKPAGKTNPFETSAIQPASSTHTKKPAAACCKVSFSRSKLLSAKAPSVVPASAEKDR